MIPLLKNWKARRAGGRITIVHSEGKVPNVDEIYVENGTVKAKDKNGAIYALEV